MKNTLVMTVCVIFALSLAVGAVAKDTQGKFANYKFMELPRVPSPTQSDGSRFAAAQANTTVLGWWQFDTASGNPTAQGWTTHDITAQINNYFHVDGPGCTGVAAVNGNQSMWCGQWATSTAPWCGWATLPGYGNSWEQSLLSNVIPAGSNIAWACAWDSEPNYDKTYVQWWDDVNLAWVNVGPLNGANNYYDGSGTDLAAGPYADGATSTTRWRFYFSSDGAWSDEDGSWPTTEGAFKVDDINVTGSATNFEDWEGEVCGDVASNEGFWTATSSPGFGDYAQIKNAVAVVQEDPCSIQLSHLWTWFDDPLVTNYACGGWPSQGAMPYGPNADGLYMYNEIWSPFVANNVGPGAGGAQYQLEFLAYRDLPLDNLQFCIWRVRQKDAAGCPSAWRNDGGVFYGEGKDWTRTHFEIGSFLSPAEGDIQVAIGVIDMCRVWCGVAGTGACHSHAPLIDQVRLVQVATYEPQWVVQNAHMWQDNFPELGGVGPTDYARCDMAQDILPATNPGILPGDSLVVEVADPNGLATDDTGGRSGKAVYVFVSAQDRFGNVRPYTGLEMQSPDNQACATDPNAGLLRWPLVSPAPIALPPGWYAYRLDQVYMATGGVVEHKYCADLMDLSAGPHGPPYHPNENWGENTGIFQPGDVIWYFLGAKNTLDQWSFISRSYEGQGSWFRTDNITDAVQSPMEWSVLPDAGRQPGFDILFVDEADEQLVDLPGSSLMLSSSGDKRPGIGFYIEGGLKILALEPSVDRLDILDPLGGLEAKVKNLDQISLYANLLITYGDEDGPGDGGTPNGGSSPKKSNCFFILFEYSNTRSFLPGGVSIWGDDVGEKLSMTTGYDCWRWTNEFMNNKLTTGIHYQLFDWLSIGVRRSIDIPNDLEKSSLQSNESFYAYAGCPGIRDFDVLEQTGVSVAAYRYENAEDGFPAALFQSTVNAVGDTARVFLAGFGFDSIRDDDTDGVPDYATHLKTVLELLGNEIGDPVGIEPVAFENILDNNYPNPFNPTTTIKYSIAAQGHVSLKIYNAAGQLVRTLVDEMQTPVQGGFSKIWDSTNNAGHPVSSGVYFYKLVAPQGFTQTKKMVVLK